MTCGILNIPDCIAEKFTDLILSIINAPLIPLLGILKRLLTQPPNIQAFSALWAVIIYILSIFYGLFIMAAGVNFIISGYNAEKRERAKEWLQNVLLMIFFVQASFFLYSVISELASGLTTGVVNMIDPNFFLLTLDNVVNVGLEIVLGLFYLSILFITIMAFSISYLFASIGIVFFPFGLFFYFITPLRDIGRFILSTLIFILFIPFFASLILLGTAELLKQGGFESIKIILMIGGLTLVDIIMILLGLMAIVRSVTAVLRTDTARGLMFLKGNFLAGSAMQKPDQQRPQMSEREYWGRVHNDRPPYNSGKRY